MRKVIHALQMPKDLPATYSISMVALPEKGTYWYAVVLSEIVGDRVTRRKIIEQDESKQVALDEVHRLAERVYYFNEGSTLIGD